MIYRYMYHIMTIISQYINIYDMNCAAFKTFRCDILLCDALIIFYAIIKTIFSAIL